jgi:hypothetical protein
MCLSSIRLAPGDEKLYLLVEAAFMEKQDFAQALRVVEAGLKNLPSLQSSITSSATVSGKWRSLRWPSPNLSALPRSHHIQPLVRRGVPESSKVLQIINCFACLAMH